LRAQFAEANVFQSVYTESSHDDLTDSELCFFFCEKTELCFWELSEKAGHVAADDPAGGRTVRSTAAYLVHSEGYHACYNP
jgi:hypothetical protein